MADSLSINSKYPYTIYFTPERLLDTPDFVKELERYKNKKLVCVGDINVLGRYYTKDIVSPLREQFGKFICSVVSSSGLKTNIYPTLDEILTKEGYTNETILLAVGGTGALHTARMFAPYFGEGIPFIYVPTTLHAMTDALMGERDNIQSPYLKDVANPSLQASSVFVAPGFLGKLPDKEMDYGITEILKLALVSDGPLARDMWDTFQKRTKPSFWGKYLWGSSEAHWFLQNPQFAYDTLQKTALLKKNLMFSTEDPNKSTLLKFGHTIARSLFDLSKGTLYYGHALMYGLFIEACISHRKGLLSKETMAQISKFREMSTTLELLGNFKSTHWDPKKYIEIIHRNNASPVGCDVPFILLKEIGIVYDENGEYTHAVDDKTILDATIWSIYESLP